MTGTWSSRGDDHRQTCWLAIRLTSSHVGSWTANNVAARFAVDLRTFSMMETRPALRMVLSRRLLERGAIPRSFRLEFQNEERLLMKAPPVGLNNRWNYRALPRAVAGPIRSPCVVLT